MYNTHTVCVLVCSSVSFSSTLIDSKTTPGGRTLPLHHGFDSEYGGLSVCYVFMCVHSALMASVDSRFLVGADL